ncbi:uncharacterized protein BCR38DRAFT_430734 [Pseudomassariella vexata]|uniref:HRQ family protein 2 n=1 Tax=Pseudomassariella vexata TaxID=1141098 RepID=A0A1Y2E4U5_9PEZI|nr:uncharacterized protein BCR38DRAFT_430734 [Pseudomassariella vexata]ORY66578.1 hypothetical protein BCR38DRAFT_430734 [Pseudomassariella vexata]
MNPIGQYTSKKSINMSVAALLATLALAAIVLVCTGALRRRLKQSRATKQQKRNEKFAGDLKILPLHNHDWQSTEPLKFRSFKPIYHITMALRSSTPSDMIVIDTNYLSRIQLRKSIMANHAEHVLGFIPSGISAVQETYSYLLSSYLPSRYPSLFSISESDKTFYNHVTQVSLPLSPPEDPLEALKLLGETVEDDIFLLTETPEGHVNVAFLCCFPSGFDPAEKLGKLMREIHEPVPGYEKIGPSMERFFSKLEVGRSVIRVNWSVTTSPVLLNLATNHVKEEDTVEEDVDVDIPQARVRMERQVLNRLPQTGAILFSFKTYMCPLEDIKAEGLGPELADAVEGLKVGNAPGMWKYKGGVRWGKSVCEYLRS